MERSKKKITHSNKSVPNIMDSVTGSENINSLFTEKFKDLYNSVGFDTDQFDKLMSNINKRIQDYRSLVDQNQYVDYKVTVCDVQDAILKIKSDKKEENGLNTNHFKAASHRLHVLLSLLFNSMMIHGVAPEKMILGTMSPLIKDPRKTQQSSDNYRSLTIGTSMSKIFDMILLKKHNANLSTSDNQFGFKEHMSTNMCTFVLNETVTYYVKNGSPVYALFLDASKAFDRLNFVKLFEKLINKGMCPITVRFLLNMYMSQKIQVKWNGIISEPFNVTNGVRQGGVLSPLLFSVYIDDLLAELKKSGIGCYIGNRFYGVIGYADDLVLLCPTKEGLRQMIKICEKYAIDHDIRFNGKKSQLLVFGNLTTQPVNITVNGEPVPVFDDALHLGNSISTNNIYKSIDYGITKFNSSFNYFMSTFGKCQRYVKNRLFTQYCMSLYGSQLWPLWDKNNLNKICVQWRKALRRVWNLPPNTHCDLLPLIASQTPIDIQLKSRFFKFYKSCVKSDNELVSFLANKFKLENRSTMSKNLREIMIDLNLDFYEIMNVSEDKVKHLYYDRWFSGVDEQSIAHAKVIIDLSLMKDQIYVNDLDVYQCDLIIKILCTL